MSARATKDVIAVLAATTFLLFSAKAAVLVTNAIVGDKTIGEWFKAFYPLCSNAPNASSMFDPDTWDNIDTDPLYSSDELCELAHPTFRVLSRRALALTQ